MPVFLPESSIVNGSLPETVGEPFTLLMEPASSVSPNLIEVFQRPLKFLFQIPQHVVLRVCALIDSPFDFDVNALQDLFPTQQKESLDDSHSTNLEFASNTAAGTDLKNQLRQLKLLIADFLHLLQGKKR